MGLFDSLGGASPGDGYVDNSGYGDSSGKSLAGLLASLLGPTQAQAKTRDAQYQPQIIPVSEAEATQAQRLANGPDINPQIVEATPEDLAAAQAAQIQSPQVPASGPAQPPIMPPTVAANSAPAPAATAPAVTSSLFNPASLGALPQQQVDNTVPTVNTEQDQTPQDLTNGGAGASDQSQQGSTGGLLGDLTQASQSPDMAHGLLQSFADKARALSDKLTNLSPNASQALLASGLAMLGSNDGLHNLPQIIGAGGIAGINNYQSNVQRQAQIGIAQQQNALKLRQQQLEEWKAANTPVIVAPGSSVTTNARFAAGQAPVGGGDAIKEYVPITDSNGVEYKQGVGYNGQPIGAPMVTKNPWVGPLNDNERTAVSGFQTEASNGQQSLQRLQGYIKQLSPTVADPTTGKQVPNPNFVSIPGGLAANASNLWTKLTGDQTTAQQLRAQIQQEVTKSGLASYKAGVGGRLTNADISMLQRGLPTETGDGEALYNYLAKYSILKQNEVDHLNKQADFAAANRGDLRPLNSTQTINGQQYPAGTTFDKFVNGGSAQGGAQSTGGATQPNQQAPVGNPANVLMQVRTAARNGDVNAQQQLKSRGYTW